MKKLIAPLIKNDIRNLRCGQIIEYSGLLYTARDQAHKRLFTILTKNQNLPFDIKNQIIYYCGPNPAKPGKVIGSCGPTTSSRMDSFTPLLLEHGLLGTIGKGGRSQEVINAIKKYYSVYFTTYAGCGALLARYVEHKQVVCFGDLGAEAVFSLKVKGFPLIVAIDSKAGDIYG